MGGENEMGRGGGVRDRSRGGRRSTVFMRLLQIHCFHVIKSHSQSLCGAGDRGPRIVKKKKQNESIT